MGKIKQYATHFYGLVILILGGLLFRQTRKTEQVESELVKEKANGEIKANEAERLAAREHADALVDEYAKLRGDDR